MVRESELSEHVYFRDICTSPFLDDEFRQFYQDLHLKPRQIGVRFRLGDPAKEHWLYESPRIPRRPRMRVYYTIEQDIVSIERIGLA